MDTRTGTKTHNSRFIRTKQSLESSNPTILHIDTGSLHGADTSSEGMAFSTPTPALVVHSDGRPCCSGVQRGEKAATRSVPHDAGLKNGIFGKLPLPGLWLG